MSGAFEHRGGIGGTRMTGSALGRLLGWRQRDRRSSGRGRARVQGHSSLDSRVEWSLTAAVVEF